MEPGQYLLTRPYVGRSIFGKIGKLLDCLLMEIVILYRIDIIAALEGVVSAILERFLAARPAY